MVWISEGRPHPAVRTFSYAAGVASRRHAPQSAAAIRRRWEYEVAVAIQRRRAAMVRACLPRVPAKLEWLATGVMDHFAPRGQPGTRASQLDPLAEEEEQEEAR